VEEEENDFASLQTGAHFAAGRTIFFFSTETVFGWEALLLLLLYDRKHM